MQPLSQFNTRRAVLISGGLSSSINYPRYLNNLHAFYACLVSNRYGFSSKDIQVVYANGGVYDLAGNRVRAIEATSANVLGALDHAIKGDASPLDTDDLLVVMTTNHGEATAPHRLTLWRPSEYLESTDLGNALRNINCYFVGVFGHRFGGEMQNQVEQNTTQGKSVFIAASDSVSYALPPDDAYDSFLYHFTSALMTTTPSIYPAFSDVDNDGHVSLQEAFNFAKQKNLTGDQPMISDRNTGMARRMTLRGLLP